MTVGRNLSDPARALLRQNLEAGLRAPTYENIAIPEDFGPIDIIADEVKAKRFAFTQDDYAEWCVASQWNSERVAPAGLLANDLLQLFTTRFAASEVVGLHTEEELWFDGLIHIGEVIRLTGRYTEKFERRGQGYVVMEAEARNQQGATVVRHRGVEIMRTVPGELAGRGSADPGAGARVDGKYDEALPLVDRIGASASAGMGLLPLRKETTLEQMAVFSRIGEFVTNIHNDLRTARQAGLNVPIVQGQQLACYILELLTRSFGPTWFVGGWMHVKFLRPVAAFEVIDVSGMIRRCEHAMNRVDVDTDVWIRRSDGSLAVVGWAGGWVPTDRLTVTATSGSSSMKDAAW